MKRPSPSRRQDGFTLFELLVSLAILLLVLIGVLQLFDLNSRIARVQTNVADMQQSLRVGQNEMVRLVRMAGRGGLPVLQPTVGAYAGKLLPTGVSVEVQNNVADGTQVGGNDVVPNTDVLTIRGVITGPVYLVNPVQVANFQLVDTDADGFPDQGTLLSVSSTPKKDQLPIDGTPLQDAINASPARPEALVLVSPVEDSIYVVAELDKSASSFSGDPKGAWTANVGFKINGGTLTNKYLDLSPAGAFPPTLQTVAYFGILEEYRYYIKEQFAIPGDETSDLAPTLAVARFYPGTDTVHPEGSAGDDIADNLLDLQVALGVDRNGNGFIDPPASPPVPDTDEWMFNDPDDLTTTPLPWPGTLYYVRINALARTDRRDRNYASQAIQAIEDRIYGEPAVPGTEAQRRDRMFRRRLLETVVDMRNLS